MNVESIKECERKSIDKLKKYQLPNRFKKVGWILFAIAFVGLFLTTKDTNPKLIAKYAMLIGLLLVSISKDKIEDEFIKSLRMHSFTFAFIFAVFIAITHPLFSYVANFVVTEKQALFTGIGDWMILWLLLSVQVFYFEYLKKMHR
jgi:hypothetical protein